MNNDLIVCFSADRTCHHDDYFLLISKKRNAINVKSYRKKINVLFTSKSIMFFDLDSRDLLFFPLILLRSIWTKKNYAISVRTEYLVEWGKVSEFFKWYHLPIFYKSLVKRFLFLCIKRLSNTKIISIHKDHIYQNRMEKYVDDFVYDPQLWDLDVLKISLEKPPEIINEDLFLDSKTILVAGRFNHQRSKDELIDYLKENKDFIFIFAGKMEDSDYAKIENDSNCIVINRFLSDEELFYLQNRSEIIYCFYTNNRPSGFFGRALQLNKQIIVRKEGFLDISFKDYPNILSVSNLDQLGILLNSTNKFQKSKKVINLWNDRDLFFNLLAS